MSWSWDKRNINNSWPFWTSIHYILFHFTQLYFFFKHVFTFSPFFVYCESVCKILLSIQYTVHAAAAFSHLKKEKERLPGGVVLSSDKTSNMTDSYRLIKDIGALEMMLLSLSRKAAGSSPSLYITIIMCSVNRYGSHNYVYGMKQELVFLAYSTIPSPEPQTLFNRKIKYRKHPIV